MCSENSKEAISEQIERMRAEMDVSTDAELARALNIDPSAVSAWRRRRSIPKKYELRFNRRRNEYMSDVRPSYYDLMNAYIFALIYQFSDNLKRTISILVDDDQEAVWIGFQALRVFNFLESEFRRIDRDDKDALRKKYEYYRNLFSEEPALPWVETLPR